MMTRMGYTAVRFSGNYTQMSTTIDEKPFYYYNLAGFPNVTGYIRLNMGEN
jgi:hypothetical protein